MRPGRPGTSQRNCVCVVRVETQADGLLISISTEPNGRVPGRADRERSVRHLTEPAEALRVIEGILEHRSPSPS
jgi:hypothetical protein